MADSMGGDANPGICTDPINHQNLIACRAEVHMLTKIKVEQLVLGMLLKDFVCSWLEHPSWRTGFAGGRMDRTWR